MHAQALTLYGKGKKVGVVMGKLYVRVYYALPAYYSEGSD